MFRLAQNDIVPMFPNLSRRASLRSLPTPLLAPVQTPRQSHFWPCSFCQNRRRVAREFFLGEGDCLSLPEGVHKSALNMQLLARVLEPASDPDKRVAHARFAKFPVWRVRRGPYFVNSALNPN